MIYLLSAIILHTLMILIAVQLSISEFINVEKKLLDPNLIPRKLDMAASSSLPGAENSPDQCILQFTDPNKYWKPAKHNAKNCYIDIDLKANHNITAVELRGRYKDRCKSM